jgi:anti-sigma B factor antagonist
VTGEVKASRTFADEAAIVTELQTGRRRFVLWGRQHFADMDPDDTTTLTVYLDHSEARTALRPSGELDAATAGMLRMAFRSLPTGPVEVDLSGVIFIDSAGLGALLWGIRHARALGDVELHDPKPAVLRLLHTTGVDHVVPVVTDDVGSKGGVTAE